MPQIVTTFTGSWISPQFFDAVVYVGVDQTLRMAIKPFEAGGIAGQTFVLTLKRNYDDVAAVLAVTGTINDATNCIVDFVVSAAASAGLTGRYVADVFRTDAGNVGPLARGQVRALQSVG